MVLPINSKPAEIINRTQGSVVTFYSDKRPWKQVRPYNLPMPYEHKIAEWKEISASSGEFAPPSVEGAATTWDWYNTAEAQHVMNLAYERLKSELGSQANLSVFLAEFSQSLGMVSARLSQLATFARHLKRGNLVAAARTLSTSVPSRASKKKKFADNYLEFHFGWSPLVSDIFNAIQVLQGPFPLIPVRGKASTPIMRTISNGTIVSGLYNERSWVGDLRCVQGVEVRIDNPALYLANSLGLVNPATVAFELVPFSFVLDWFVNVEAFISSMTDFLGLEVSNAFHSVSIKPGSSCATYQLQYFIAPPIGTKIREANGSFGYQKRVLGLSTPTLYIRPWKMPGLRRCLAAVSLVVQQLSR